jgi:hypothetical protein
MRYAGVRLVDAEQLFAQVSSASASASTSAGDTQSGPKTRASALQELRAAAAHCMVHGLTLVLRMGATPVDFRSVVCAHLIYERAHNFFASVKSEIFVSISPSSSVSPPASSATRPLFRRRCCLNPKRLRQKNVGLLSFKVCVEPTLLCFVFIVIQFRKLDRGFASKLSRLFSHSCTSRA